MNNRSLLNICLAVLFFWLLVFQAEGQIYHSQHYTIRDGLPSNNVRTIFKDSRNIVWIGTDAGLCTFDGKQFTRYPLPKDIESRKVWAITEDPSGNMWFGTFGGGILKFDGRDFTLFTTPDLTSNHIRVLTYSERLNCLLAGTQYGFSCISDEGIFSFVPDTITNNRFLVMSFIENHDGIIFHTFSNGTYHFNPITLQIKELPDSSPLNVYSSSASYITSWGDTLIGLHKTGLRIISKDGIRDFHDLGQVFDIREDKNGLLWISVWSYFDMKEPGGLYTFDGNTLKYVNPLWDIPGKLMWSTYIDNTTETIFLTTEGDGMYKLINNGIGRYPASYFGTGKLEIYDLKFYNKNLWITAHDRVIFGNIEKGFKILDENWFKNRKMFPDHRLDSLVIDPPGKFLSMHIDHEQNLWVGSVNAIFKKQRTTFDFDRFNYGKRFSENFIVFQNGKAFSGSWFFFRISDDIYNSDSYIYFEEESQFEYPTDVNHIISRDNEFWFSSFSYGLYRYKDDQFKWYGKQAPDLPQNLNALCLDRFENIVVGTTDGRVLILEGSDSLSVKFELDESTGIVGNEILWLLADSENRLWIGTNMGLNILNLNLLYVGGHTIIQYINEDEGYLDFTVRRAIQDENGFIWIGGMDNLIRIEPEKLLRETSVRPKIKLTGFEINFKPVKWDSITHETDVWRNVPQGKVVLGHRQNNLAFIFTVDNLINPDKVVYSYFLGGFGMKNPEFTPRNEVAFTNLAPGKYILQISATNLQSGIEYEPMEVPFKILPPWWQTWYFYTALFFLILSAGLLVVRNRILRVRNLERIKLEHEKRLNSIRIQAAQAQMNPHFVFNVLSSIQSFMLDNDMDSTLEYLNDFSVLIRKTMENISEETILLSDEIDYLKRYVKLENLRLGYSLQYRIMVDQGIEHHSLRIPPMIIQPFVENAIKHGLSSKEVENRKLCIIFQKQENSLQIQVGDNGAGIIPDIREKRSGAYHRSRGINNTTERIRYFTQFFNGGTHEFYGVKIHNRERKGKVNGVKVEINLPLIY